MIQMRTIVDLPAEQLAGLARLCTEQKISRAEAVRQAVDRLIKDSSINRKNVGFGIWRHKGKDPHTLVNQLRNEWEPR